MFWDEDHFQSVANDALRKIGEGADLVDLEVSELAIRPIFHLNLGDRKTKYDYTNITEYYKEHGFGKTCNDLKISRGGLCYILKKRPNIPKKRKDHSDIKEDAISLYEEVGAIARQSFPQISKTTFYRWVEGIKVRTPRTPTLEDWYMVYLLEILQKESL